MDTRIREEIVKCAWVYIGLMFPLYLLLILDVS